MTSTRAEIAKEGAVQAGKQLLEHFINGNRQGILKADQTLVTKADQNSDQLLHSLIQEHFPGDGILSEESSTIFPGQDHVWVLDPLDGTVNFSQGLHYWGVSIAHFENGFPQNAAIYFPLIDELYSASRGAGAFLNDKQLHIAEHPGETLFPIFVHCSRMHQRYQIKLPFKTRSLGAAAYHLCLVSNSTAVLAFESTPKIWDFAAGWLIIQEAGGLIQSFDGRQPFPAQVGKDYQKQSYPIVAAASKEILSAVKTGINKI